MTLPTFEDVLLAKQRIAPYLLRTPLHRYAPLDALIGAEVFIKHENYQPIGAFKVRGGINLVSQLPPNERQRGLISASTGNHGQSIAYAGRMFGVPVTIVVPETANPGKVAAMRGMGADVILHGENFEFSRRYAEQLAEERSARFVHAGNEPHLIAGVGTVSLEILETVPDLDVLIVPVGGGSGASGACLTAKAKNPATRVIGVQAEAAPAAYLSWKNKRIETAPIQTFAEGLQTGEGFSMPQAIIQRDLDEFVLVSDDAMKQAMVWMIEHAHTLAEAAGAAPLAAAYQMRERLAGQKVALVCTGANTSLAHLKLALDSAG
ncbi:MAG: threonine/serine dehydratase [Anaerolineae bacterium]|nr:threonine/serine dehydratase [Anaerolineae bacterium]